MTLLGRQPDPWLGKPLTFTSSASTTRASSRAKNCPRQFLGPWMNGTNCRTNCQLLSNRTPRPNRVAPKCQHGPVVDLAKHRLYAGAHHVLADVLVEGVVFTPWHEALRSPRVWRLPCVVHRLHLIKKLYGDPD
jgi:hypothetical protein